MHPLLKPAMRRGWRDLNTVQFGVAPAHAMVLGPVDTATSCFLGLLDGTRGLPLLYEEARGMGLTAGHVDDLIRRLTQAGLLDDARGGGPRAAELRGKPEVMDRLRPDLASLSVIGPEPDSAIGKLAARRTQRVQVRGAGRVGAVVASVLAGAGIGQVDGRDGGRVEPWDVAPGGHPPEAVGERRTEALGKAVRRAAPDRPPRVGSRPGGEDPLALVVIAPRDGLQAYAPDPATTEELLLAGTPHLFAGVIEGTGVVGPLVVPGMTACAGCLWQRRAERDPTWPRLLAQWRSGRQRQVATGEVALTTTVAALAAAHALAFLDGERPTSAGARWEVSAPWFDWQCKAVWPHRECACGADRQGNAGGATVDARGRETMSR